VNTRRASGPGGTGRSRWAARLWWAGAGAAAVLAAVLAVSHRHELAGASHLLTHVSVPRLAVAIAFEAASFVSLAALQRWLLRTGGARLGLGTMAGIVVAANAMAGVLPGGSVFSVAWTFRQLRRRGAGQALAAAALAAAGALSFLGLALLLAAGALAADPAGPAPQLRTALLAAAAALVAVSLLAAGLSHASRVRRTAHRAWKGAATRWPAAARLEHSLATIIEHAKTVQPGLRGWLRPFVLALLNWACDAAALASALWALGIGVPWRGLLIAYGLTQISASLRLTPGSLGIAEASLTALLVLYGLSADQALAATLLYRIISFWLLQPIGWAAWLRLTLRTPRRPSGTGLPAPRC
jgi:hypothetical protein